MKKINFSQLFLLMIGLIFAPLVHSLPLTFTKDDLEGVLQENLKLPKTLVKKVVQNIEQTYGRDQYGHLAISSVLIAKLRPNITLGYDFLTDISFDAFIPSDESEQMEAKKKIIRFDDAVHGHFTNHGLHLEVISGRKMIFLLPKQTTLLDLDGIHLHTGQSSTAIYNLLTSFLGVSYYAGSVFSIEKGVLTGDSGLDRPFYMHYISFNFGIAPINLMSFPTLKTHVNWDKIGDEYRGLIAN